MSEPISIVQSYLNALNEKDLDGALKFIHPDAQMATPMGLKKGTTQIRGMLEMIGKLASEPVAPATIEDGDIVARSKSMMGTSRIFFTVEDDLITNMSVKMGG